MVAKCLNLDERDSTMTRERERERERERALWVSIDRSIGQVDFFGSLLMGGLGECISLRDLDDDKLREEERDF